MSAANGQSIDFKLIRTEHEIAALEDRWNNLFKTAGRGPQLFQSFSWFNHWRKSCQNKHDNLLLLTGYDEGELVVVAPLVIEKKAGVKIIKWAGEPVSQYGDILIKDDASNLQWLKDGFNFLIKATKADLIYLRKTRFDSAVTPLLENYAATVLEENVAPYIETLGANSFTEFNKRYSQRSRKSKRRHRRKLEEKGKLTFHLHKPGNEAEKLARHAIQLKRDWLRHLGLISPAFIGNRLDDFFSAATRSNDNSGILVSELRLDERPIALEIGIRHGAYYGAHLGAYDPAFIAHGPGSLQMQETIGALINEGVEIIDLFAPGDTYKFEWTDQSVPVYDFAYPTSPLGTIYEKLYLKCARPGLKKIAGKVSDLKQYLYR